MSASLSALPSLAVVAGNLLANGGEPEAASSSAGEPGQFAACFEFLLGKQLAVETTPDLLPALPTASTAGEDPVDELAALLPFIEALGMTQAAAPLPSEAPQESETDSTTVLPDGTTVVPAMTLPTFLATATTAPAGNVATPAVAIPPAGSVTSAGGDAAALMAPEVSLQSANQSAAASPAIPSAGSPASWSAFLSSTSPGPAPIPESQGPTTVSELFSLPTAAATPTAPAISAANASPQGQANGFAFTLPLAPASTEPTAAPLGNVTPGNEPIAAAISAGREFASQLVATIAASKETQQTPGTTADAVHNVIAQAVPGRANVQEAAPVISQAVGAPGWSEEIGNRVAWMAGHSESRAELVLNPPQMGRVEVNLTLKGDQATASFASSNPVVREALEAALPRLREVLADAGIQLGQTQVGAENAHQWTQQEKNGDNSTSDLGRRNAADPAISRISSGSLPTTAALKTGRGFVDVFA